METEHTSRVTRRRLLQQAGAVGLTVAAGGAARNTLVVNPPATPSPVGAS